MTSADVLDAYFAVTIAALGTLTVSVASFAAAYVIKILNQWRHWGE